MFFVLKIRDFEFTGKNHDADRNGSCRHRAVLRRSNKHMFEEFDWLVQDEFVRHEMLVFEINILEKEKFKTQDETSKKINQFVNLE